MTLKERKILSKIKQLVSTEFELEKLYFYGSRVYGTANPYSDFDILIITKNKLDWQKKRRISDLTLKVDLEYDVVTDIKIYSKYDIEHTMR